MALFAVFLVYGVGVHIPGGQVELLLFSLLWLLGWSSLLPFVCLAVFGVTGSSTGLSALPPARPFDSVVSDNAPVSHASGSSWPGAATANWACLSLPSPTMHNTAAATLQFPLPPVFAFSLHFFFRKPPVGSPRLSESTLAP